MTAPDPYPCTVRHRRATMTEEEFWNDVARSTASGPVDLDDDGPDLDDTPRDLGACPTCGELGPCGYDAEGRPMIHTTPEEEE